MFGVKLGTVSKVEDDIILIIQIALKKSDEVVRKLATTCSLVKATKY